MKKTLAICAGLLGMSSSVGADSFEIVLQPSELLRQGNDYLHQGELEKAKKILVRALDSNLTNSQRANVHNSLCVAHIKEEDWSNAMDHCDSAIEKLPMNWRFHNNRGNIYFGLGNYHEALSSYQKGRKIAPKSLTIAENIKMLEDYTRRRGIKLSSIDPA